MLPDRRPPPDPPPQPLDLAAFQQPRAEAGLSLDQLHAAFAEMLDAGQVPYPDDAQESGADSGHGLTEPGDAPADRTCELSPRTILEALLFVGQPDHAALTSQQIAGLMRGVRPAEIDALVRELNADYFARNCPYHVVAQGAGYRLELRPAFAGLGERFQGQVRAARLSQAAVEVLAAVAYHQPISADEVARLRGTPSGPILAQLVRRQLLLVARDEAPPHVARYSTTDRFLDLFGLSNLEELPHGQDLEEP